MEAKCHCGTVRLEVARPPAEVFDCNCSICRRLGVLWAYYRPQDVSWVSGRDATMAYLWGDHEIEFHACKTCGCTTHWQKANDPDKAAKMGVNARLMDELDRSTVLVHQLDGSGTGDFWPPATPGPAGTDIT
jgi:hypothetical protein